MAIHKPSELMAFLESLGIQPKKVLSQNFLVDGNIIRKIVKTANVSPADVVLEIGPGPGSLTEGLLEGGAHVIAVEKDNVLAGALERLKTDTNQLDIYCEDILEFPIAEVLKKNLKDGQKAKVIANLPYHLTTPILIKLVQMQDIISSLVLMVQQEVGQRFTAIPGNHHYGSLTVFLNFYSKLKYGFTVSKQCFYPKPKVESAIVILELKEPPFVADQEKFFQMTRTSFEHRRKMMRSSLRELYPPETIMEALSKIGKNPQSRPEELSLDEFLSLFAILNK